MSGDGPDVGDPGDWLNDGCPGLRRVPQQARSRARVAGIVTAAERILVRAGVDGLTMRVLADEAGVPTGTVYQFFHHKSGVLDTVVHRHGVSMPPLLQRIRSAGETRSWREVVDLLLTGQVERLRRDPAYVAIWVDRQLSPQAQRQDDRDVETMTEMLCDMLERQEGLPRTDTLLARCRVVTQAADSLLYLAFRLDPRGDATTLAEIPRILLLYLEDIVTDLGSPQVGVTRVRSAWSASRR